MNWSKKELMLTYTFFFTSFLKVSTEALEEAICAFEDYVQSVDIAAFNKI